MVLTFNHSLFGSLVLVATSTAFFSLLIGVLPLAETHSRLMEPPGRSSIWRLPEFQIYNPPVNVDDNQLFCGGFGTLANNNMRCGVCGDNWQDKRPRENESGGKYDIGLIVRNYTVGQIIPTASFVSANHGGFFKFSICPRNSSSVLEEEECFRQNPISLADGSGDEQKVPPVKSAGEFINTTLLLPPGLACSHCVFRWQYTTGSNWYNCTGLEDWEVNIKADEEHIHCGPQEIFRACAEIGIH